MSGRSPFDAIGDGGNAIVLQLRAKAAPAPGNAYANKAHLAGKRPTAWWRRSVGRRDRSFVGHVNHCRLRREHGAPLPVDGGGRGDGYAAARHFWVATPRRLQRSEPALTD
jgi:hypothetical protein